MVRKGILGTKLGMTQVFTDDNQVVPVTVLRAGPCPVTQVRTVERDGYRALQLGFGRAKRANKPLSGHFAAAGVEPTRHLVEVAFDENHEVGDVITVGIFRAGELVDVTARSKGKGFSGVMKRHGFAGLGAGHGAHKVHRRRAPSARAPRRAACSREHGWLAARERNGSPSRVSRSSASTPSGDCC
jgi:large subunit ribosomal protein L3